MNLISNMPASLFIPSVHISGIVLRVAGQIVASPPGEQFRRPDTTPVTVSFKPSFASLSCFRY
ncbi:hypothetical protein [Escherichia coli]|uniref:hypothetical protein n=1 Tax=Escherichia coli TaxID=562 RepID=UPI001F3B4735|nr:hypothetical protein [Escherichia coli]